MLIAIVGTGGLRPALAAIEAGKDIAVASKEILVMAGETVMDAARRKGVKVLPVDSEHNAIFQCLEGRDPERGAPAHPHRQRRPFPQVARRRAWRRHLEQALKHPTWNMGAKITIDSATLFNKGLEMIEARWLFDVEMARVEVIVHPQIASSTPWSSSSTARCWPSSRHSDMCFPIQYAVTWPERVPNTLPPARFRAAGQARFRGARAWPISPR